MGALLGIGGWKTKVGAFLILGAQMAEFWFPQFSGAITNFAQHLGEFLAIIGIGHKLDKAA